MDDKTFQLLEKMYTEFSTRFDKVESDITSIKGDVQSLKGDVQSLKKDVIHLENNHGNKLEALLDGYQQLAEKQLEHDQRFDQLDNKLKKQDVEICLVKGGLKA